MNSEPLLKSNKPPWEWGDLVDAPLVALGDGLPYFLIVVWALVSLKNGQQRAGIWIVFVPAIFFLVIVGLFQGPVMGLKVYTILCIAALMGWLYGRWLPAIKE